ncbi:MAG: hypothetical protein JW888_11370 [Pirellulales bacterium]|nr:hypothetical protein [Pirellulales bacterium]
MATVALASTVDVWVDYKTGIPRRTIPRENIKRFLMRAALFILLGLTVASGPAFAVSVDEPRGVVVAVCPAEFRRALAPWVSHRKDQGYDVRVVSNTGTPEEIRRRIRQSAPAERLKFLVLVGDIPTGMDGKPAKSAARSRCVPAPYADAKVNIHWGSEPIIPNDAWYADLDDDGVPELAEGRLTADTPEELKQIVDKILAYERSTDFGSWRRQLNFVAGVGGFGALADMAIDSAARYLLTKGIPADYRVWMTQANWRAVYCPDPRNINQATIDRLNDGAVFWTYIGHGNPQRLGYMHVPGKRYSLLATRDVPRLDAQRGPSIALFLACYVGAIDNRSDCLAEEMLRQRGGPVAVVASSRVAMPYAMAVMGMGLMEQCFERRTATLGEALLQAKRTLVNPAKKSEVRTMLDTMASLVSPSASKLEDERAEHVMLFNLIGDPCLRIRYPQPVTLLATPSESDPTKLIVEGRSPIAGRAVIELVRPLGRLGFTPPRRSQYPKSPEALAEYELVYRSANDQRVGTIELRVAPGAFRTELELPNDLAGTYQVHAFVEGKEDCASGWVDVRLGKSPEASESSGEKTVGQTMTRGKTTQ